MQGAGGSVDLSLSTRTENGPAGDRTVVVVGGEIDVYTAPQPASAGCIDAYKLNECGVITDYFCR